MIRPIWHELIKMVHQKKNFIPLAGYILFILLCYTACVTSRHVVIRIFVKFGMTSAEAGRYLDGLFFARLVLLPTFLVLMPIVMAALGGDCVAGEMQDGSLKLYLARPRSRTGIILRKFIAIYLAGFIYSVIFACGGIAAGIWLFDLAPVQLVLLPDRLFGSTIVVMSNGESLISYVCASLYFSFSLMTLGAMSLWLSTIFNRMSSAVVAVVTLYFISYVVGSMPLATAIKPWLISEIMNNAFVFYLDPIPWGRLIVNLASLALYISCFLLAAVINFNYKDIR